MSVDVLSGAMELMEGVRGHPELGRSGSPVPGMLVPLVLGPRPERVYSHSLLLELKDHPLAKRWPPYLDPVFKNQRGVWDPDRWHLDRKRGETPVMGSLDTKGDLEPREAGGRRDREIRRERVGLEQDGEDLQQLVLSPQRRSFLGGCSSGSGLGEGEVSLRPEQPGKRVGSGRILARQERSASDLNNREREWGVEGFLPGRRGQPQT